MWARPAVLVAGQQAGARPLPLRWTTGIRAWLSCRLVISMETDPQALDWLKQAIRRAQVEMRTPPAPGEIRRPGLPGVGRRDQALLLRSDHRESVVATPRHRSS